MQPRSRGSSSCRPLPKEPAGGSCWIRPPRLPMTFIPISTARPRRGRGVSRCRTGRCASSSPSRDANKKSARFVCRHRISLSAPSLRPLATALAWPQLSVPVALDEMVVDHPYRLHEGIADRAADEPEAAALQVLAHRVGLGRASGNILERLASVLPRLTADKAPNISVERAMLLLNGQKCFRVGDCRFNLKAVPHDSRIGQQSLSFSLTIRGDSGGIEPIGRLTIIVALVQNRGPAQSRLGPFEDYELEKQP